MTDSNFKIPEALAKLLDQQKQILGLLEEFKDIIELGTVYQRWDAQALKIVQTLAPDRYDEFVKYYLPNQNRKLLDEAIQDYVRWIEPVEAPGTGELPFEPHELARVRLLNQLQILGTLACRIDAVLADVEGNLFTELQDKELAAARLLKETNPRAAGALAGLVLERHLRQLAANRALTIPRKQTSIRELNDPLLKSNAYGLTTWRTIQMLGDLRNLCSSQRNGDLTKEQAEDLIYGVSSVIKSVF